MSRRTAMCAMIANFALATPATAHMPYVLPSVFDAGTRPSVTVEAAFTEDAFRPEVAMDNAPFEITAPDGRTTPLPAPAIAGDRTLAIAALPADGIYRISSGQRSGRMGKMYRGASGWVMIGEGAAPPAGATLVDVRSKTLADVYVLHGRPAAPGALAPRGRALEIHPLADPTALGAGEAASFAILHDGKPLTGEVVTLFREAGIYDGRKQVAEVRSDAKGQVSFTPPDAGRYLMLVRHRTATPGQADAHTSFTATLAFEAGE